MGGLSPVSGSLIPAKGEAIVSYFVFRANGAGKTTFKPALSLSTSFGFQDISLRLDVRSSSGRLQRINAKRGLSFGQTKIVAPPAKKIQDFFRVILLEPKESLNIGSVARAMMNLGFQDLILVSPLNFNPERAATTARRAKILFEPAQLVATLEEALAECTQVVGFSTKDSKNTPPVLLLEEWSQSLPSLCVPQNAKIGLLFGPEDTGLRYEHFSVCNSIVRIPTCDQYDSLNLAQAALLVFYSIAHRSIDSNKKDEEPAAIGQQLATLETLIQQIAEKTEFENEGTPQNTMGLLKSLFRRPDLKYREMQIILGFFSRIAKTLK